MNLNINKSLSVLVLLMFFATALSAQKIDSKVIRAMECANAHFINLHPDAGAPTFVKKRRPSNLWTRGVYFEGLSALLQLERDDSRQKEINETYIYEWANAHKWTPRNGVTTRDADDYCCCQTYLDLWLADKDKADIKPTIECIDNIMKNPQSLHDWTWIDAIQMGLPVFTTLTKINVQNAKSLEYAKYGYNMYLWTRDSLAGGLFNKKEGLWWRDKDFVPPYSSPKGTNCYWSRGNGWVYAALVRAMEDLKDVPGAEKMYEDYKADFLKMTEALVSCKRKDGFWNVDLLDETNYGGKELTGTALFVYGMAWGVNNGILETKYKSIARKSWKRIVKDCLHEDGFLGFVQGTGKQPQDSQPVSYTSVPDFDDFGLGCFLLAGSEVAKLN